MIFVGREKEIKRIEQALEEGHNVIVTGKYGIGRTSLIKRVSENLRNRWRFVFTDFSTTPGTICYHLLYELFPGEASGNEQPRYPSVRFRIAHLDLDDKRKHVLVFDNIGKLSVQKLHLIRDLTWEKKFQFVAIAENFLSKADLMRLRVGIQPAVMIDLRYLRTRHVRDFFRNLSEIYGFRWEEAKIKTLTQASGGYPLRMRELAIREIKRNRQVMDSTVRV